MEEIILTNTEHAPNASAVSDGPRTLTYAELIRESYSLSKACCHNGVTLSGEPIGILLGPGMKQVVAQLAVRFAGGTCVPMEPSPSLPVQRMSEILHDIDAKHIIVDDEEHPDLPATLTKLGFRPVYIAIGNCEEKVPLQELKARSLPDRSHILFTSGSTGKPKPVQIRASGILHLASQTPVTPLMSNDRVAEFNNPGFDLSLFEIWATLVAGATIVAIPRHTATDPHSLPSYLEDQGITIIIITAALFEIIAFASPTAFRSMRHVLTAGDVANVRAMRACLQSDGPPQHLWNTYGPTECTTLASMFEVKEQETRRDRISIGRPVGDMEIYLFDGDTPIKDPGRHGEIYIAGPQQCIGYLGLDAENASRFLELRRASLLNSKLVSNMSERQEEKVRLYRTGDLGERRPGSDDLDFVGRLDNQVKHKGFRIELGEIECAIQSLESVHRAVVVQQPPVTRNGMQSLVAFVVVDPNLECPTDEDIMRLARNRLAAYMVPDSVNFVSSLPLTSTGKVDRKKLAERCLRSSKQDNLSELSEPSGPGSRTQDIQAALKSLWQEILNMSRIGDDDDFFLLGGMSLQAAALIAQIRHRLGRTITMEDLTSNSRLGDLASVVQPETKYPYRPGLQKAPDNSKIWMGDIDLVDDIEVVPSWDAPGEGKVFVTGSTGFVGAHLLRELMLRPTVKHIVCLVRFQEGIAASLRLQQALERYDLWPSAPEHKEKVQVLEGNIADQTLGLGKEKFGWLADWASVIFHLGAKVNFCESYRDHREPNVVGTANILRLAASGRRKSLHYMSTIDVWGTTGCTLGTEAVYEDGSLQPHIQAVRYDLGYAQSQWTAESMVRRMRDRGLPITIYRPGFVIGNPDTGCSNPADFVSRLLVGCIQMGTWPQLIQRLEYVTIDYVINAMLHIATDNSNLGRSYCLVAPNQADSVTVEDTCRVLNDAGYPVRLVDYDDWVEQVDAEQRPDGPLAPLLPNFQEPVLGPLTRWTGSQYSPWYRADQAAAALRNRPDIKYRPLDSEMVRKFINFWNRKGFYHIPVID